MAKGKGPHAGEKRPSGSQQRPAPRSASRRKRERRREQAVRSLSQPKRSRRFWLLTGAIAAVVLAALIAVVVVLARGPATPPPTATTTPTPTVNTSLLAPAGSPSGATVDGVDCQSTEQVVYHIHAHLAIFVNGSAKPVPEGIGIKPPRQEVQTDAGPFVEGGACFYWLHTHTADGIIHIESPSQQMYTLGTFFDIWGQPLTASAVGPAIGTVTAYVNGQAFTGDPRSIVLSDHAAVQLDVGSVVPPASYQFPPGYQ